jgi:hypothetical protein
MTRLLLSTIAVAPTFISLAYGSSTVNSVASSPASALSASSGIEVDVIFPIQNATYNITESLPIIFALQNLTAATALGPFTFAWDIMPFGRAGETPVPGGVLNDAWSTTFTAANSTIEPYILVNQTDVQKWKFGPYYPAGSIYALQWFISWNDTVQVCDNSWKDEYGLLLFNIDIDSPEPSLENLTGKCPQLGSVFEMNTTTKNSSCAATVSNGGAGDPCAVMVDKAMVGSISSAVQSLITASAAAASTTATATGTHSPPLHSIAVSSHVSLRNILAALFLLGSLQMVVFS